MTTTEDKIKEAFEAYPNNDMCMYEDFKAGYLACMNGLEPAGFIKDGQPSKLFSTSSKILYLLPEGVTKP